jgi:hypothetical protein
VTISGNTIRRTTKAAVHLNGTIEECEGFVISGNTMVDVGAGAGVYCQNATDVAIVGNRFRGGSKAIVLENSDHIGIGSNHMRDMARGISITGDIDTLNVSDNNLRGVATPLFLNGTSGPNVYVRDNAGIGDW